MTKYCFIVIAVLFCAFSYAQSPTIFHRGYPLVPPAEMKPDTSLVNISGLQLKDGNYVSLDGIVPEGDSTIHFLLITKFMKKGDIAWSQKIALGANLGSVGSASMYQSSNDSIYFSASLFNGSDRQLIGALEPKDGKGLWMKVYTNDSDESLASASSNLLVEGTKDSLAHQLLNFNDGENNLLILNKMLRNGTLFESKNINFKDTKNDAYEYLAADYVPQIDGFIATGAIASKNGDLPLAVMTKFDLKDKVKFSRAYSSPDAQFLPIASGLKITKSGTDFVIIGQYLDLNFADIFSSYFGSFVMKVDSIGKVIWSKIIDQNFAQFNSVNGLTLDDKGNIIISGKLLYNQATFHPFMVSLKADGSQNWFNIYEKSVVDFTNLGKLVSTMDKGLAYFHNDIENQPKNITKLAFIKTDDKGKVGCETPLEDELFVDHTFVSDTILSEETIINANTQEFKPVVAPFSKFDVPILSLNIRPFCPNEEIDFTIFARVKDAVKWEWSDNSKADSLRIFKTGQFSVTVTIEGKYCFMLCDTATAERTDLPEIQALKGPNVCIGAPFKITSSSMAASSVSAKWMKDGKVVAKDVGEITVSELGKYTVTIIDQCGDSAKSDIVIDESIYFPAPSGAITRGVPVCKDKEFTLTANGSGGGGGPYTFLWSENNATTSIITVNKLGTYKVTVTDNCNLTAVQSINVDESVWLPAPSAAISLGTTKVCKNQPFTIFGAAAGGGGEPYKYLWNTGATTESIVSSQLGVYGLTVTDKCDLKDSESITIGSEVYYQNPSLSIETSPDNTFCQTGKLGLIAVPSIEAGGEATYKWSNEATSASILVDGNGSYSVTITDRCNNTATSTKEINDATAGSNCVKFPKVFLPDAKNVIEVTYFGGINLCGVDSSSVNGYTLNIFNRWGKPIFSSTDIKTAWDGTNGNREFYPPDAYVWYARYNVGKFCKNELKGDVTMLR